MRELKHIGGQHYHHNFSTLEAFYNRSLQPRDEFSSASVCSLAPQEPLLPSEVVSCPTSTTIPDNVVSPPTDEKAAPAQPALVLQDYSESNMLASHYIEEELG